MLLDLHTHHPAPSAPDLYQVLSLRPCQVDQAPSAPLLYRSIGLHPWYEEDLTPASLLALEGALRQPHVLALGEMGLDKLCPTPLALQEKYFCQQIELADALSLPVILHVVRAWDELLRLKKLLRPKTPWIIHGYRGKGEQARQLLAHGFCLSFGALAHSQALQLAFDAGRLFLETDDRPLPAIRDVYELTAQRLGCDVASLSKRIMDTGLIHQLP